MALISDMTITPKTIGLNKFGPATKATPTVSTAIPTHVFDWKGVNIKRN